MRKREATCAPSRLYARCRTALPESRGDGATKCFQLRIILTGRIAEQGDK